MRLPLCRLTKVGKTLRSPNHKRKEVRLRSDKRLDILMRISFDTCSSAIARCERDLGEDIHAADIAFISATFAATFAHSAENSVLKMGGKEKRQFRQALIRGMINMIAKLDKDFPT